MGNSGRNGKTESIIGSGLMTIAIIIFLSEVQIFTAGLKCDHIAHVQ